MLKPNKKARVSTPEDRSVTVKSWTQDSMHSSFPRQTFSGVLSNNLSEQGHWHHTFDDFTNFLLKYVCTSF